MDHLKLWALPQAGVFSRWQLIDDGVTPWVAFARGAELRTVFDGVYVTGWGPITPQQRWWAATLTAPRTVLDHRSAGAFWGFCAEPPGRVTVVRPGRGGPRRVPGLTVRYSATLTGHVTRVDGLAVTTPVRTVIDVWPALSRREREKMLREALRQELVTQPLMRRGLHEHRGRRGVATLRATLDQWSRLPFHRCKSDAEAFGLTVLHEAGVRLPLVNAIVAGHEADFCWPDTKDIVELDGPQWHVFKELDAAKTAAWTRAGFRVRRLPTDDLFATPDLLLEAAPPSGRTSILLGVA